MEESKRVACTVCPCNGDKLGWLFFPGDHKKWKKNYTAEKDKVSTEVARGLFLKSVFPFGRRGVTWVCVK